ncbi:MAG: phosphoglycerate kinase, partial [Mailhella sp.]|nr:phosphoglycerate kinase [Mailhella sp.]
VLLLENVRFLKGEKKNSPELAQKYASLGDVFIMDAFGTAHRAQATTEGVIQAAQSAAAGPLMIAEMEAATKILDEPKRPLYAIVGGSKVSTKLTVLENLIEKVDGLIVGGGIANTFLLAQGYATGNSLTEPDLVPEAKKLLELAKAKGVTMPMPKDAVVAKSLEEPSPYKTVAISEVGDGDCIFDIGPETVKYYSELLANANTIVWNGPVGAFETKPFDEGTKALAERIAGSGAYSVICGGDTVTAVENMGFADKMSYLSTGGGAFLEVLEGKTLPAVAALAAKA